jgi:hypothetical protein
MLAPSGTRTGAGSSDLTARYEAGALVAGLLPLLDQAEATLSGQRPALTGLGAALVGRTARQQAEDAQGPVIGPDGNPV